VLGVRLGEEHAGNAVFDVMLVTDEPARISEYSITGDTQIQRFRADGVVVSTPAGSHGYSNTAGGPVLATRAEVVSVVPIAAFTTRTDTWVLDPPIRLGIERDEGDISLLMDDREQCTVPNDRPITISVDDSFETVRVDG
jgi:NAD+ kinase